MAHACILNWLGACSAPHSPMLVSLPFLLAAVLALAVGQRPVVAEGTATMLRRLSETSGLPYNCMSGVADRLRGWSEVKKTWCCEMAAIGCELAPARMTMDKAFDCTAGWSNCKDGWSGAKKDWCFHHEGHVCPPVQAYNCSAGIVNWEMGWSKNKKQWCCRHKDQGCPATRPATMAVTEAPLTRFQHFEATLTTTSMAAMSVMTRHVPKMEDLIGAVVHAAAKGCDTNCFFKNMSVNCRGRIQWSAEHEFTEQVGACSSAYTTVLKQCPVCSVCLLDEAQCEPYDCHYQLQDWDAKWDEAKKRWCCKNHHLGCPKVKIHRGPSRCDTICNYTDFSVSCKNGIRWLAMHEFQQQTDACVKAERSVHTQCPQCYTCNVVDAGCTTLESFQSSETTHEPYDCRISFPGEESVWSWARLQWCCINKNRGCTSKSVPVPDDSSVDYDCNIRYVGWDKDWSLDKRRWCCMHKGLGCSLPMKTTTVMTSAPQGCDVRCHHGGQNQSCRDRIQLSASYDFEGHQAACVRAYDKVIEECPTCFMCQLKDAQCVHYNCQLGVLDREESWSQDKRTWCCTHTGRGCQGTTSSEVTTYTPYEPALFDCGKGYWNFQKEWSTKKKAWCCKHEHRACPESFSTTASTTPSMTKANFKLVSGWSLAKDLNGDHGCTTSALAPSRWSLEKKAWCCKHHKVGCLPLTSTDPSEMLHAVRRTSTAGIFAVCFAVAFASFAFLYIAARVASQCRSFQSQRYTKLRAMEGESLVSLE